MHIWDLRRLRLLHVLQVHHSGTTEVSRSAAGAVVAMHIKEETGELALATSDQLQLWSINAALLAVCGRPMPRCTLTPRVCELMVSVRACLAGQVSHVRLPSIRCMALTPTPEWMVEALPVMATGHEDGTVRWWVVREPASCAIRPGSWLPRSRSAVPVGGVLQPAWELVERSELRLRAAEHTPITTLCLGEGCLKLLWTGDARGEVRSWSISSDSSDYFTPLAERF